MALEGPLRSSIGSQLSGFSHHHKDMSVSSPDSEALQSPFISMSSASSDRSAPYSNSLRPSSIQRLPVSNMNLMSPSDIVGPSPVTSNGTETTEIEDEEAEESDAHVVAHASSPPQVGSFRFPCLSSLVTLLVASNAGDEFARSPAAADNRRSSLRDTRS
ncbi:hypothetical protein VDGD_20331 [Verticillium dahliae]|nr:hypothetical protein VDGD_20331 [Verticillium dahliae]